MKPTDKAMYKTLKWMACGGGNLPLDDAWDHFNSIHHAGKKGVYENFLRQISLDQYYKLRAINEAFTIHYLTLHDCTWMDREKMLRALDETAEKVKTILDSHFKEDSE